jgi:hypothetical protein
MNRRSFIGGVAAGAVAAGLPERNIVTTYSRQYGKTEASRKLMALLRKHGRLVIDIENNCLRDSYGRIVG